MARAGNNHKGNPNGNVATLKPFSKEFWETPEGQELTKARSDKLRQRHKEDPWRMRPWGIPRGKSRKEAIPLWRAAHKLADKYLDYMKETDQAPSNMDVTVVDENGVMPHTAMVIPESDEEKAVVMLREAFLLAVGPTAIPEKLKAINTVLTYTKTKPEAVSRLKVEKAEDFLDLIAEVRAAPDDEED